MNDVAIFNPAHCWLPAAILSSLGAYIAGDTIPDQDSNNMMTQDKFMSHFPQKSQSHLL
jgi:hypothetical protein